MRIREEQKKRDWRDTDLAEFSGVSQAVISRFMSGGTKTLKNDNVLKIAKGFGISEEELRYGAELKPSMQSFHQVPVISWSDILDHKRAIEENIKAGGVMVITNIPVGSETYAVEISGNTMEPEFVESDCIIVEPTLTANCGDFVIALVNGQTTFKKLVSDMGDFYLQPINPIYPVKPLGNGKLLGVIRGKLKIYR